MEYKKNTLSELTFSENHRNLNIMVSGNIPNPELFLKIVKWHSPAIVR